MGKRWIKKKIILIILLFLTTFGVIISGVLHPDTIICIEPIESTSPDFYLVYGEFKLRRNLPENLSTSKVDYHSIWTENYEPTNVHEVGEGPYIHFITGKFTSLNKEVNNQEFSNPQLYVYSGFKIHSIAVYLYFSTICALLTIWVLKCFKQSKR